MIDLKKSADFVSIFCITILCPVAEAVKEPLACSKDVTLGLKGVMFSAYSFIESFSFVKLFRMFLHYNIVILYWIYFPVFFVFNLHLFCYTSTNKKSIRPHTFSNRNKYLKFFGWYDILKFLDFQGICIYQMHYKLARKNSITIQQI